MKMTKIGAVIFLLLFILSGNAIAEPGRISFGNLKIIPSLTGQVSYDNNIYLKNGSDEIANKTVHDWIYHVMPGVMLNYTMPERGSISLGYQGDWAFYNENGGNNWKSQKVMFNIDYNAPGGFILGIDNLWNTTEDPYGSSDQYALGRVTKRWTDDLKGKVGYNFAKVFKVLAYYNFSKQEYNNILDFTQNYNSYEYGLGLESKIMSRTWGFLRYHYGQRYYNTFYGGLTSDLNSDYTWHRVNTGLTWDATAKLSGEINVGYMWKKYKNEFADAAQTLIREDRNTWIAATSVTYKPLQTTAITLRLDRAVRDTSAGTNEYFDDTGFGINLKQTIYTKFILNVEGLYSRNEYNLPVADKRVDNNYSMMVGVDYNIQDWLTTGINYKYMRKDSNYTINEFRDDQVMATVKVIY